MRTGRAWSAARPAAVVLAAVSAGILLGGGVPPAGGWHPAHGLLVLGWGLVAMAVGRSLWRPKPDPFDPLLIVALVWSFGYLLPGHLVLAGIDPLWGNWATRASGETVALVDRALGLAVLFLAMVLVAYLFPLPRIRRPVVTDRKPGVGPGPLYRVAFVAFAVFALIMLATFVMSLGGLDKLATGLNDRVRLFAGRNFLVLPIQGLLGLLILESGRRWERNEGLPMWLALFGAMAFAANTVTGSKTTLLASAVAFMVTWHYRRRALRPASVAAAGAVLLVLGLAFDLFFREFLVLRALVTIAPDASALDLVAIAWERISSNTFLQLQTLMLLVDGMPDRLPYQLGLPYVAHAAALIPRALFPGKPPVATEVFSAVFFEDLLAGGTSIPVSLVGEFYLNFGVLGVVFGGLAFGATLRAVYGWMRRRRSWIAVAVYAVFVATLLPWLRGDSFGPTIYFLSLVAPMTAVYWIGMARVTGLARAR